MQLVATNIQTPHDLKTEYVRLRIQVFEDESQHLSNMDEPSFPHL